MVTAGAAWQTCRRCPACGLLLEEWRWPLEPDALICCGRCGRLWTLEAGRLEPVRLELVDDELRPFLEQLAAAEARRFWTERIHDVLTAA